MSDTERDTGDTNVERLLSEAYKPEQPDAEFVASERERLRALAAQVAKSLAQDDAAKVGGPVTPAAETTPFPFQPWMFAVAAAAILAVGIGIGLGSRGEAETAKPQPHTQPGYQLDGNVVWIGGKPFVARDAVRGSDPSPLRPVPRVPKTEHKRSPQVEIAGGKTTGLTPHKRTAPKELARAKQGATLVTKSGERRRVALADGSVLYLNENTTLRITGQRRVELTRGELFVEVAPRKAGTGATFVVKTPKRTVSALGTKFGVLAEKITRVLVTQGAVKVSGVAKPLRSGMQLLASMAGEVEVEPLSRMDRELDWTRELIAASETPLVPKSKHAGGALIAVDPHGQETKLTLRKYRVDVHIEDGFARTTIDQTYFNHQAWRMEGTFYFPLPAGAAISRLAMYVNGKLMEGGMAEKNYARSVYEQIRFTRRDPALLEWLDGSTFKMRVFPLEGRQEKRIVLSYTQRLESVYGQVQYRFPAAHTLGLVKDLAFHVRVVGHGERGWKSSSHTLAPSPAAGDLVLDMAAKRALINKDLVLDLQHEPKRTPKPRFTSVVHEGSRYLMLRYRPQLVPEQATSRPRAPRSWVFLYESSGDRDPLLARTQLETIRTFLENAEHQDEFSILTAGTRLRAFAKEPRAVSRDNVRAAMTFLESTHLIGALDLNKALKATQALVEHARQRKREVVLVHLGSGIPVLGQRSQKELVAQVPSGARYVGVGVGKRWERAFMKAAASKTGGVYAQINPDDEVRWRSYELFSLLNTRSVQGLTVRGGKTIFRLADDVVYDGGEVCAVARLSAGAPLPERLVLNGKVQGKPWTHAVPVADVRKKADYLPRYWAKLEIDRLVGLGAKKHQKSIVALSKAMYVMSPFTSLLVLENEAMYKQFKVDRGRKDHWALYPCPKAIKVVREPGNRVVSAPAPGKRLSAQQVLGTILVRLPQPLLYWPGQNRYSGRRVVTAAQAMAGTHGYGWLHNWRDWQSGRGGMRQWAQRNELTRDRRTTFGGGNRAMLPAFRPVADPAAGPAATLDMPMDRLSSLRAGEATRRPRGEVMSRWGLRAPMSKTRSSFRGDLRLSRERGGLLAWGDKAGDEFRRAIPMQQRKLSKKESADSLLERFRYGYYYGRRQPLYQPPRFHGQHTVFNDLLAFAPGMNTTRTDILSVLEAEARPDARTAPGRVASQAAALIAKARQRGWQKVLVPRGTGPALTVLVDGQGRFRYVRTLGCGLKELVVSDGTTLWHLYPELAVGARRVVGRFHRDELRQLVPWFLPPAADLARGNDLLLQAPNVVSVVPRGQAKGKPRIRLELHFAADGRLTERRWVRDVSKKPSATLGKEVYAASGNVRWFGKNAVQVATRFLTVSAGEAPSLAPETKELVVLPLPLRTQQHVLRVSSRRRGHRYANWKQDQLLAYVAACYANNGWTVAQIYKQAFRPKGDNRLGWYVLIQTSGARWNPGQHGSPQTAKPDSTLARYLMEGARISRRGWRYDEIFKGFKDAKDAPPLLRDMLRLRYVFAGWQGGAARRGKPAAWLVNMKAALEYARQCHDPRLAWAMQNMVMTYGYRFRRHPDMLKAVQKVLERFASVPGLDHAARYEQARAMWNARKYPEASKAFRALYEHGLKRGELPKVDHTFYQAIRRGRGGAQAWSSFVRSVSLRLVKEKRRPQAVSLAWQCWQLGDRPMANETLETALTGIKEGQRLQTTLAAIEYLWWTQQPARADTLVQGLLKGKRAKDPGLWRLGAHVAQRNGKAARALKCLERALDMEFANLPEVLNLQALRQDYGQLLGYYQKVADAISTLEQKPPLEFVARVVRAADRWRSLDTRPDLSCQSAAKILQTLRVNDLAWEYLTTPLAKRPGESGPWLSLARRARGWGNYDLADRAFENAFDAEQTNAQILWERAQLLQQAGRSAKARGLFKQLAEGKWQPRFRWIQQWAKSFTGQ